MKDRQDLGDGFVAAEESMPRRKVCVTTETTSIKQIGFVPGQKSFDLLQSLVRSKFVCGMCR